MYKEREWKVDLAISDRSFTKMVTFTLSGTLESNVFGFTSTNVPSYVFSAESIGIYLILTMNILLCIYYIYLFPLVKTALDPVQRLEALHFHSMKPAVFEACPL
jgi:Ca2+/Na+ antiporter